ncbi:MAG: caspase family protein [Leptospiraceae bacterium]|nr:caspase family protein [Leptospiraceae bacterium]
MRALHYSTADAKDFFEIMKKQKGKVYNRVNADNKFLLTDKTATRENIFSLIEEIRKQANKAEDDVTMVFLSGHGTSDMDNMFYFLPHDYNTTREERIATSVSGSDLLTELSKIKGKVILFVDACYSGNLTSGGLSMKRLLNEANDPDKWFVVFSSSSKFEVSLEHADWKNGAFTKAFKEAMLEGKLNKPKIKIKALDSYISDRVLELTKEQQTPESQGTGRDFIIGESIK